MTRKLSVSSKHSVSSRFSTLHQAIEISKEERKEFLHAVSLRFRDAGLEKRYLKEDVPEWTWSFVSVVGLTLACSLLTIGVRLSFYDLTPEPRIPLYFAILGYGHPVFLIALFVLSLNCVKLPPMRREIVISVCFQLFWLSGRAYVVVESFFRTPSVCLLESQSSAAVDCFGVTSSTENIERLSNASQADIYLQTDEVEQMVLTMAIDGVEIFLAIFLLQAYTFRAALPFYLAGVMLFVSALVLSVSAALVITFSTSLPPQLFLVFIVHSAGMPGCFFIFCVFLGSRKRVADVQKRLDFLKKTLVQRLEKEELLDEIDDAKHALKEKQDFVATVAHEIKTPLHGLVNLIDLFQETKMDSVQKSYLEAVDTSIRVLVNLVNDVLDVSRLDAGRLSLEYAQADLLDVVHQCCVSYYFMALRKGVELAPVAPLSSTTMFLCDRARLTQIVNNLVSNAVKFTAKGSVSVSLRLGEVKAFQQWRGPPKSIRYALESAKTKYSKLESSRKLNKVIPALDDAQLLTEREKPDIHGSPSLIHRTSVLNSLKGREDEMKSTISGRSISRYAETPLRQDEETVGLIPEQVQTPASVRASIRESPAFGPSPHDSSFLPEDYVQKLIASGVTDSDPCQEVFIEVVDEGIGIDEVHLPNLFKRFGKALRATQSPPTDGGATEPCDKDRVAVKGTGLGLSICKDLTELMGGDITVTSVKHKGSRFTLRFVLPVKPALPSKATDADHCFAPVKEPGEALMETLCGQVQMTIAEEPLPGPSVGILSTSNPVSEMVENFIGGCTNAEIMSGTDIQSPSETEADGLESTQLFAESLQHCSSVPSVLFVDVPASLQKITEESLQDSLGDRHVGSVSLTHGVVTQYMQQFRSTMHSLSLEGIDSSRSTIVFLVPLGFHSMHDEEDEEDEGEMLLHPSSPVGGIYRRSRVVIVTKPLSLENLKRAWDDTHGQIDQLVVSSGSEDQDLKASTRGLCRPSLSVEQESSKNTSPSGPSSVLDLSSPKEEVVTIEPYKRHRVLVVDDDAICSQVALLTLKALDIAVETASSGLDCLRKLEKSLEVRNENGECSYFTVILMDAQMPEMDGLEATMKIRQRDWIYKHIPVVCASAGIDDEKWQKAGMNSLLAKPFRKAQVLETLQSYQILQDFLKEGWSDDSSSN